MAQPDQRYDREGLYWVLLLMGVAISAALNSSQKWVPCWYPVVSYWYPIGILLVSCWYILALLVVSYWYPTGILLVPYGISLSIPFVSCCTVRNEDAGMVLNSNSL